MEQSIGYFSTKRSMRFKVGPGGFGSLPWDMLSDFSLLGLGQLLIHSKFKIQSGSH